MHIYNDEKNKHVVDGNYRQTARLPIWQSGSLVFVCQMCKISLRGKQGNNIPCMPAHLDIWTNLLSNCISSAIKDLLKQSWDPPTHPAYREIEIPAVGVGKCSHWLSPPLSSAPKRSRSCTTLPSVGLSLTLYPSRDPTSGPNRRYKGLHCMYCQ